MHGWRNLVGYSPCGHKDSDTTEQLTLLLLGKLLNFSATATDAKSLQSCPTLCNPIDGSPPGSPVPGILQARTLEWVAISFSNAWKWKWKWSRSVVSDPQRPHGLQPTRFLHPWDFPGKSTGVGCHCLLCNFSRPQVFRSVKWTANYLTEVVLAKFCPLYRANI